MGRPRKIRQREQRLLDGDQGGNRAQRRTAQRAGQNARTPCTYCGLHRDWLVARWNQWFCDDLCARAWRKEQVAHRG